MSKPTQKLFDSVAGGMSFMPATLTGCGCLAASIIFMLGVIFAGTFLGEALDSSIPEIIGWLVACVVFIALMRFARSHS